MSIAIRVAFNNEGWAGRCSEASTDPSLWYCRRGKVSVGFGLRKDGTCVGECWERHLCARYRWKSPKNIHLEEAAPGEKVFFVFREDGKGKKSYVLWSSAVIDGVEGNSILFEPFRALPEERWVRGLSAEDVVDAPWGSAAIRRISAQRASALEERLDENREQPIDDAEDDYAGDSEGRRLLRRHVTIERSARLRNRFRQSLKSLACAVCDFDFEEHYGTLGSGYVEIHHTIPVSQIKPGTKVELADLEALCSNCHSMLHRKRSLALTSADLRRLIAKQRKKSKQ